MQRAYFCILAILINAVWLRAQAYLWPTNATHLLSATFGEYRRSHLHAGIDIKTNQRTGYPVLAVADGYIWKVRTNFRGYGKVIYQHLDDGNYAVYAHLQGFNTEIRQLIEAEQAHQQRYAVEVTLSPQTLRVTRGTIIGYTGDSGTLAPHLHFELRDSTEAIINPLIGYYQIRDNLAPVITGLAVSPVGVEGRIEGQPLLRTYAVHQSRPQRYYVRDTIQVTGKVGIEISTYDQADGSGNRFPPYGLQLFVDDTMRYQIQYDRFSYEEIDLARIDRNYQLDLELGKVFNRLWTFNTIRDLPMQVSAERGLLDLPVGLHTVRIEAYDANGNRAILQATLRSVPIRNLQVLENISGKGGTYLRIARTDPAVITWRPSWCTFYGNEVRRVRQWRVREQEDGYEIVIAELPQGGEVLKIESVGADGSRFTPLWLNWQPQSGTIPTFQPRYVHNPKTFLIQLTFQQPPPPGLQFYLQTNTEFTELPAVFQSPTEVLVAPLPFSRWQRALALELRLPTQPVTVARLRLALHGIPPGGATTLTSEDNLFQVTFPSHAVYDTLLAWWSRENPRVPEGARLESPCYTLLPTNQPLAGPVEIIYKIGIVPEQGTQLGLCRWQDGQWRWLETSYLPTLGLLSAQSMQLGTFAVLRDTQAPVISKVFPGDGGRFRATAVTAIRARVFDELSGISDDLAIRVSLDDQPIIVEYDAAHRRIFYPLKSKLSSGTHLLRIEVRDRAENISVFRSNFTILPD